MEKMAFHSGYTKPREMNTPQLYATHAVAQQYCYKPNALRVGFHAIIPLCQPHLPTSTSR